MPTVPAAKSASPWGDVVEAVGAHNPDPDGAGSDRIRELRQGGRDGVGHDRYDGEIVSVELLGAQAEGGCQPSFGGNKRCQLSCVACEVQRRLDALRVRFSHRGGEVTTVIDHPAGIGKSTV